jgi:hypothetical protein
MRMKQRLPWQVGLLMLWVWLLVALSASAAAQNDAVERRLPQSKTEVENALKSLEAELSGRLPVLEGFALPGDYVLDRYKHGYYQSTVKVVAEPSGGSLVRVTTKVTAWYSDPQAAHSGYRLLKSNGRLEGDLLDQLSDTLVENSQGAATAKLVPAEAPPPQPAVAPRPPVETSSTATPERTARPAAEMLAAPRASQAAPPQPAATAPPNPQAAAQPEPTTPAPQLKFPEPGTFASSLRQGLSAQLTLPAPRSVDQNTSVLEDDAKQLEEIIRNQSHPRNLVAVKRSGTPVVSKPSLNAKTLFLASMHDEFEMLDFNEDWVHVRISGLSRGWIWRNSVEMPDGIADTAVQTAPPPAAAADLFRVTREEAAPFPGDWQPLRGKSVKIISVQKVDENGKDGGPQDKLGYAKYLLETNLPELLQKQPDLAGIVVIFDAADGGMLAATSATLQQWKAGMLSDAALWHNCFFDPPETFMASAPSGTQ